MSTGGTTTQTTVQNTDPWKPAQPYLTDLMGQAQSLYNSTSQNVGYAPFNTVAPMSEQTQQALNATWQRAMNGSPLMAGAEQSLAGLMQPQSAPGMAALQGLSGGYYDPGAAYTQAGTAMNPYAGLVASGLGQQNAATGLAAGMAGSGVDLSGNPLLAAAAYGGLRNPAIAQAYSQANQNPYATPAMALLGQEATGGVNPYLNQLYSAASQPVMDSVNSVFGQAGRTGSGANQQELTRDLGDLAANIYGSNYNQALQNQMAAATQIQNAYDAASGRNLSAVGLMGNLAGQDISNQLAAANNLNSGNIAAFNAQQGAASLLGNLSAGDLSRNAEIANQLAGLGDSQLGRYMSAGGQLSGDALNQANVMAGAAGGLNSQFNAGNNLMLNAAQAAPALASNDYNDLQNALSVGGAYDTQAQNQINDLLTRWQYQQQQPWNLLDNYSGLLTGFGGLGSSTNGTVTTRQQQSLVPTLINAAAQLGSSAITHYSDIRLKENIARVGTADNGLPLYLFNYKGSDQRMLGLMAQDVHKVRPEAVVLMPNGYLGVDYRRALGA